jgi:hypothetical protein
MMEAFYYIRLGQFLITGPTRWLVKGMHYRAITILRVCVSLPAVTR